MLGLSKRRKQKQQRQVNDCLRSIEDAIFRSVLVILQERGTTASEHLPRSVVNKLLGRTCVGNGSESCIVKQIAADLMEGDSEVRDAVFISLQALLAVEGEKKNFEAERRILETIQWLKKFGEMPRTSHDSETLRTLAERLGRHRGLGLHAGRKPE